MHTVRRATAATALVLVLYALVPRVVGTLFPGPGLLEGIPFSQVVQAADGTVLRVTLADDERYRVRYPLDAFPKEAVEALLLQEDRWFHWHPGVNPVAVLKAVWETATGQRRRGASTLTMQLVRMRDGLNTRTLRGKVVQMVRAVGMELRHSKAEILEAYLNLAPYGGNVEGLGAAAWVYTGQPPARLSLNQVLALTVVPQHPARRGPVAGDGPETALGRARARLWKAWVEDHPQDADMESTVALPTPWRRSGDMPFVAPHFTQEVLRQQPLQPWLSTSLSMPHQNGVDRVVRQHLRVTSSQGMGNAAVLVVDADTLQVRAMVGSGGFFDVSLEGQVDGTQARRSPGSALKPFIYALAVEQGLIHPRTLLKDAPTRFAEYVPDNFDGTFMGPLSAQEALVRSRNVPAVELLNRVGAARFHGLMRAMGVGELRSVDHYGLGLALGGVEVTLRELVAMYAALANGGLWQPLQGWVGPVHAGVGRRVLSPEAAHITLAMLREAARPAAAGLLHGARGQHAVAFKTGTSNGSRDAWAVGVVGRTVVGVWQGNFDGRANARLVGISAAAPLLFKVVEVLAASGVPLGTDPPPPEGVTQVKVCAVSGALPGPHCSTTVDTLFVPGVSPIHTCALHRAVAVNAAGQRECQASATARMQVMEFWPSDLLTLFAQAGVPRRVPPAFAPGCAARDDAAQGMAPTITSPQAKTLYVARQQQDLLRNVPLLATSDADARTLHWFADDAYLGHVGRSESLLWKAPAGHHVVRVVDDLGRSASREVEVALVE